MYETWVEDKSLNITRRSGGLIKSLKRSINKCKGGKGWVIDVNTKRIVHIEGFNKNYGAIL